MVAGKSSLIISLKICSLSSCSWGVLYFEIDWEASPILDPASPGKEEAIICSMIKFLHLLVGGLEHLDYLSHHIGNFILPTDFH